MLIICGLVMRNIVSTHSRIIGIIPDIRSHSDQWDSTIFRISILVQTWGFYYIPDIRSFSDQGGLYYNPDIHSYSDQGVLQYYVYSFLFRPGGFYYIPDICSYSDQGVLQYYVYSFLFRPGGSTIFRISVLI